MVISFWNSFGEVPMETIVITSEHSSSICKTVGFQKSIHNALPGSASFKHVIVRVYRIQILYDGIEESDYIYCVYHE